MCLWVDVGRGREWLVLRTFSGEVCSKDGQQAQLLGEEGFMPGWRDGVGEGRTGGEMGRRVVYNALTSASA